MRHECASAQDGAGGLELARALVPDLIVLDIQLPTLDGYAVARVLRHLRELERTPIVAVTSYAMVGDREKALEAGCNGYIEKPIDPDLYGSELEELRTRFVAAHGSGLNA